MATGPLGHIHVTLLQNSEIHAWMIKVCFFISRAKEIRTEQIQNTNTNKHILLTFVHAVV